MEKGHPSAAALIDKFAGPTAMPDDGDEGSSPAVDTAFTARGKGVGGVAERIDDQGDAASALPAPKYASPATVAAAAPLPAPKWDNFGSASVLGGSVMGGSTLLGMGGASVVGAGFGTGAEGLGKWLSALRLERVRPALEEWGATTLGDVLDIEYVPTGGGLLIPQTHHNG